MKKYVVVDIDGCISDDSHRRDYAHKKQWDIYHGALLNDQPMNQQIVNEMAEEFDIIYCTGRTATYIEDTELWLKTNFFPYGIILMRRDGDFQSATTLKPRLLEEKLGEGYADKIHLALDNDYRIIEAYRSLGINARFMGVPNEQEVKVPPKLPYEVKLAISNQPAGVPEILESAADLYRTRNKEYSNNYKHFGNLMKEMFPNGVPHQILHSNKFGVFMMILGKVSRLASSDLQHDDSAKDLIVYASMLYELIMEERMEK